MIHYNYGMHPVKSRHPVEVCAFVCILVSVWLNEKVRKELLEEVSSRRTEL